MGFLQVKIPSKKHHDLIREYWNALWTDYVDDYVEVFIQCWNTEARQMEELLPIAKKVRKEGLVHYFRVTLNNDNKEFLKQKSFDFERNQLKWFMVRFIREDASEGIEVRDYGVETIFNQLTTEQANLILQKFEHTPIELEFTKDSEDE